MKNNEYVILLHGLARTHRSWGRMGRLLTKNGYHVINLAYPSRKFTIEELSNTYLAKAINHCSDNKAEKIHFVTHSMGGILVRYFLKHHAVNALGHVVMLSPPNQGSELIDIFGKLNIFLAAAGPAGQQLGTTSDILTNQLGAVNYPVGIITGNRSINPILSMFIPGENDGKVSVESSKLVGMQDFRVVPSSHSFIMQKTDVIREVCHYLKEGSFHQR